MNEAIPSPFMANPRAFEKEIEAVCKKYGYEWYFLMTGEKIDAEQSRWTSFGNVLCDGMVESLEGTIEYLKTEIDRHSQ